MEGNPADGSPLAGKKSAGAPPPEEKDGFPLEGKEGLPLVGKEGLAYPGKDPAGKGLSSGLLLLSLLLLKGVCAASWLLICLLDGGNRVALIGGKVAEELAAETA